MTGVRAEVLAIGDELVHGHAIDTNSAHIARELEARGLHLSRFSVVSDDPDDLDRALADAAERADLLIATGGIGPTEDDRTRHAAAAAAGVGLEFHEPSWRQVEAWFAGRGRVASDSNRRQALRPVGADALENQWGTAPGLRMQIGRCRFFALPGVPREMKAMLAAHVLPDLATFEGLQPIASLRLHVLGLSEAQLGEQIGGFMRVDADPDVTVGITAHCGMLTIRVVARGTSQSDARAHAERTAAAIRPLVPAQNLIFEGDETLTERVGRLCLEQGQSIGTAESCTGGLLSAELTELPGIAEVFLGGFVTYSDAAKTAQLGVPSEMIQAYGAVSEPVAGAMARGAAQRLGTRFGIGITGIAGPTGGTADKPVGTVCFGLCHDGEVRSWRVQIPPVDRQFVRRRSVFEVLAAMLRILDRESAAARAPE